MPVFRRDAKQIPAWSELRDFETLELGADEGATVQRTQPCETVVAVYGSGQVLLGESSLMLAEGQFVAVPPGLARYELRGASRPASFMRLAGSWGPEIAGCGIFQVLPGQGPKNVGDPVDYPKLTGIDRHYHDYDEYWIVLDGSAVVRVDADEHVIRRGDCLATGKGHHHDIAFVHAPFRAVYFEGTLRGRKRLGHLWNYKHGQAEPDPART